MSEKKEVKSKGDLHYNDILEKASIKQQLHMFSYTGSQALVKKTKQIFADRLYFHELLPYVCEYGYEAVNNFCLVYSEKIANNKNE